MLFSDHAACRSVEQVVPARRTVEGAGFAVRRPFPTARLQGVDPFLMLDHMGPTDYAPGQAKGAPDHPHRGFQTVTYMLDGEMEHKDSQGHAGRIGPGDVQWMTAGAGVVHSEMPSTRIMAEGGRLHGFQIWVNLPARDKMVRPDYQELPASRIPVARSADGGASVRVIAGEALGQTGPIQTRTPIVFLHFTLAAGAQIDQPLPETFNALAYVIDGDGCFGVDALAAAEGEMAVFARDGAHARLANAGPAPLNVLLLAGAPLNEPVARYGPFVMNTEDEIMQAISDYRQGRMGIIDF